MAKDLHQILRERARQRAAEEAADAARGAADVAAHAPVAAVTHVDDATTGARASAPRVDAVDSPLAPFARPVVLAALLFVFALGFYGGVHYGADLAVRAAETDDPGVRPSDAPPATADELRRIAREAVARRDADGIAPIATDGPRSLELDLADPANQFTIQVISYDDRATYGEYADATRAHLAASGLRAVGPLGVKGQLVVLVEAAPTRDDLRATLERVRALPDAAGRKDAFKTAMVRRIDDLVDR